MTWRRVGRVLAVCFEVALLALGGLVAFGLTHGEYIAVCTCADGSLVHEVMWVWGSKQSHCSYLCRDKGGGTPSTPAELEKAR